MILQALTEYYEALVEKDKVPRPGWSKVKISYALEIDDNGTPTSIHSLKMQDTRNGKTVWIPREIELPAPVKRTVGILPNFLYDNATYILCLTKNNDDVRAKQCFSSAAELHKKLFSNISKASTNAVMAFFEHYNAEDPPSFVSDIADDLASGVNIVFMYDGKFIHDDPEIRKAWQKYYDSESDGTEMICLVTGEPAVPMSTHPAVKGIKDAQSSGAALVSFNDPSAGSFDRTQNLNAPVGKYASFAYTTALNYLVADRMHNRIVGDSTVVFWAEDANESYQDLYSWYIDGESNVISDEDLKTAVDRLSKGMTVSINDSELNPENAFYILALSPNAARISVRMFLKNNFGTIVKNISDHYNRLHIAGQEKDIPLWRLLGETTLKTTGKTKQTPSPQMSGDVLRAILTGGYYPATLYQQIQLRIRADRDINGIRAAIIKAYLLKNTNSDTYKEVIKVKLNEETVYQPYILGRLFAVLEMIQEKANPGINTTIKDKYFSSACASPATVFPTLMSLSEKHLRKLESGNKTYCEKLKSSLTTLLTESYPAHLTLYDQGIFQLGYYHQRQKRFEKKDNNTVNEEEKQNV